jgi:hypothetical protein
VATRVVEKRPKHGEGLEESVAVRKAYHRTRI